jgi:hypothetical protein
MLWALILTAVVPVQARWTPFTLETVGDLTPAVGHVSDSGLALGALQVGVFGPNTMALWQEGQLMWTLDTYADAFGGFIESDGTAWGLADMGELTIVLKVDVSGDVLQTWSLQTDPTFTTIAAAIDGDVVVRTSGGSGSSYWESRICRADGSVELIPWDTALYAAAVGRLADGQRIVVGSFEKGGWWRGFMRSLDDGPDAPLIDLATIVDVDSAFVHAESVSADGWINLRYRDEAFSWRALRWSPDEDMLLGPPIPFVASMDVDPDSGAVAASGQLDGVSTIWRWIPGQDAEYVELGEDDLAVMNVKVDRRGVVLASVLTFEPIYGQDLRVWLPEGEALIPVQRRTVGALPDGDLMLLFANGAGDAVLRPLEGMVFLASLDPADVDGDGTVGVDDLLALIAQWGVWNGPCGPDLDFDGDVDVDDALLLLSRWS